MNFIISGRRTEGVSNWRGNSLELTTLNPSLLQSPPLWCLELPPGNFPSLGEHSRQSICWDILCICSTRFFATSHLKLRNFTVLLLLCHSLKAYFAPFPLIYSSLLKCKWMKAAEAVQSKDMHWKFSVTLQRVAWYSF